MVQSHETLIGSTEICLACGASVTNRPKQAIYYQKEQRGLKYFAGVSCNDNECYCIACNVVLKATEAFRVR